MNKIYVTMPLISLILNPFETMSVYMQDQMKTFSIQWNIKAVQCQWIWDVWDGIGWYPGWGLCIEPGIIDMW